MRKILAYLLLKLIGVNSPIENREYPYETEYGKLTVDQANTIHHYIWFGWELGNVKIPRSTKVIVYRSARNEYFENFEIKISEFTTIKIEY